MCPDAREARCPACGPGKDPHVRSSVYRLHETNRPAAPGYSHPLELGADSCRGYSFSLSCCYSQPFRLVRSTSVGRHCPNARKVLSGATLHDKVQNGVAVSPSGRTLRFPLVLQKRLPAKCLLNLIPAVRLKFMSHTTPAGALRWEPLARGRDG